MYNPISYRECPKCKFPCDLSDYMNKDGDMIYSQCKDCRRKYKRKHQAERRSKIKAELAKSQSASQKPIYPDTLTRLRHYLLRHAGYMCQACGQDNKMNLKLIHLDGLSLTDVLYLYIDNMNHDTWNDVLAIYKDCILMCDDCAAAHNHDIAKSYPKDITWKANLKPKPPM